MNPKPTRSDLKNRAVNYAKKSIKSIVENVDLKKSDFRTTLKNKISDHLALLMAQDAIASYDVPNVEAVTKDVDGIRRTKLPLGTAPGDRTDEGCLVIGVDETGESGWIMGPGKELDGTIKVNVRIQPTPRIDFVMITCEVNKG